MLIALRPWLVCSAVAVWVSGCAPGGGGPAGTNNVPANLTHSSQEAGGKRYRIAVIPKGTTHEFWKSVHAGAERAARELGNVDILWKGPVKEDDREGQIQVVQDFVVQKVDGICLAPLDSQALVEYVEEAVEKGVPVVIFDSGLDKTDKIVSYVATDNFKGGELAADRLAEVLNEQGHVILLRYNQGSESTFQREEGFLARLKNAHPQVKVISSEEYAGTTPEGALEKAQQVLQRYRDEVDGIFAVCEPNATGVLGALNELNLAGKVKFVAFDPNVPLVNGLAEGKVDGIILQDPVQMGYAAVMTMMQHLSGQPVEPRISTGEYVATPQNMNEDRMQQLLKPVQYGE